MEREYITVCTLILALILSGCAICPKENIFIGAPVGTSFGILPGEVFIEQGWLDDPEHYGPTIEATK